jgi:hypothetical protein
MSLRSSAVKETDMGNWIDGTNVSIRQQEGRCCGAFVMLVSKNK